MSFLYMRLLPYHRHMSAAALPAISPLITPITTPSSTLTNAKANFHTSTPLQRGGSKNPKIGITLEQLRMAARGQGRRLPICHAEQEKVMNALEAAKYENWAIYKYVKEVRVLPLFDKVYYSWICLAYHFLMFIPLDPLLFRCTLHSMTNAERSMNWTTAKAKIRPWCGSWISIWCEKKGNSDTVSCWPEGKGYRGDLGGR